METINVAKQFSHRLQNRDKNQGDGSFNGEEFRNKYLKPLDNIAAWESNPEEVFIILDFKNVIRLGPSWANEVFAYFTTFAKPKQILKKIKLLNISDVKLGTIECELNEGYRPSTKK